MANTPTTPASVASRLTDEEILRLAHVEDRYLDHKTAAVLRDYVRLRNENDNTTKQMLADIARLSNFIGRVREKVGLFCCKSCYLHIECLGHGCASEMKDLKCLLAEAEKGETK